MSSLNVNISQVFTEVDAKAIANGAPLAMSVELAKQVEGNWSGEIGHVERDAALVDARVRPLNSLVLEMRAFIDAIEAASWSPYMQKRLDAIDAALKAAGVE